MNRKRIRLSLPALAVVAASFAHAQPTNNPVSTFYPGLDRYDWTDSLKWADVTTTNATADDDTDDLATVQAEIIAISEAGGGTLYFPAGAYDFSDDLYVYDGVILRGVQAGDGYVADNLDPDRDPANPVAEIDNAKTTDFTLETKFEFPKYVFDKTANGGSGTDPRTAFKAIRLNDPFNDSNVGIAWIDINRARIEWTKYGEDENGMASSYWGYFGVEYDPSLPFTDPSNMWRKIKAKNWVVFGNRINNAARWDNRPGVAPPIKSQDPWQIWPKRISAQIDTFNYENNLVANNRLMDKHFYEWDNSQPNGEQPSDEIDDFLMTDYKTDNGTVAGDVWFAYSSGHGIKMNRSIGLDGKDIPYTPDRFPMLFRRGIVCRDNWTFVTRRVGVYIGGDGMECIGNYRADVSYPDFRKLAVVDATGRKSITGAPTLENRGFDITGSNVIFTHNYYDVFRHKTEGPYYSTDGEGVLHQEVGGGTAIDNWLISKNVGNAYIGIYKSRDIRRLEVSENTITNIPVPGPSALYVVADTNNGPFNMEDVLIENNTSSQGADVKASLGVKNVVIRNNDISGTIRYTQGVTLENNTGAELQFSKAEEIPPAEYDALPDGAILTPTDEIVVAPGETITFTVTATDDGDGPTGVSIWRDLIKEGDAVEGSEPGTYTLEVTAPTELGAHYYFLEVNGSPHEYWTPPTVVRVQESAPYEPQGWTQTPLGWVEDFHAPWFYLIPKNTWIYNEGFEIMQGEEAPNFYLYSYADQVWGFTNGQLGGWVYEYSSQPDWVPYDN